MKFDFNGISDEIEQLIKENFKNKMEAARAIWTEAYESDDEDAFQKFYQRFRRMLARGSDNSPQLQQYKDHLLKSLQDSPRNKYREPPHSIPGAIPSVLEKALLRIADRLDDELNG